MLIKVSHEYSTTKDFSKWMFVKPVSRPHSPLFSVCGGVGDQCYCAQMPPGLSGHGGWEAGGQWQPQEAGPGLGLVNNNMNNVNLAADSYIRQFEEAYSASYSNISSSPGHMEAGSSSSGKFSAGSPLKTSSPNKTSSAFLSYHNLGLGSSYYPQLSPDKQHQYLHSPEADNSSQQQQQQHLVYHGNSSYNGDMSSDYIQPCHIFQVGTFHDERVYMIMPSPFPVL